MVAQVSQCQGLRFLGKSAFKCIICSLTKKDFNWCHVQVRCLTAGQLISPQLQHNTLPRMTYAVNISQRTMNP